MNRFMFDLNHSMFRNSTISVLCCLQLSRTIIVRIVLMTLFSGRRKTKKPDKKNLDSGVPRVGKSCCQILSSRQFPDNSPSSANVTILDRMPGCGGPDDI